MTDTIVTIKNNIYGAFELKKLYPRNFSIGLAVAVFFHLMLIGSYYAVQMLSKDDNIDSAPVVRIMKYSELGPPPSITNEVPPQVAISGPAVQPTVGVPVPVPDEEAPPEQTIASQEEMSAVSAPSIGDGLGAGTQITQDIKIETEKTEEEPGVNDFVPVESYPEIVVSVQPEYPEIARRAGITGRVFVKVLVDKTGKPKKAVIFKSDSEFFNDVSIEAAMKTVFTPALQNQHPIAVWVVMPYKFTLQGGQ